MEEAVATLGRLDADLALLALEDDDDDLAEDHSDDHSMVVGESSAAASSSSASAAGPRGAVAAPSPLLAQAPEDHYEDELCQASAMAEGPRSAGSANANRFFIGTPDGGRRATVMEGRGRGSPMFIGTPDGSSAGGSDLSPGNMNLCSDQTMPQFAFPELDHPAPRPWAAAAARLRSPRSRDPGTTAPTLDDPVVAPSWTAALEKLRSLTMVDGTAPAAELGPPSAAQSWPVGVAAARGSTSPRNGAEGSRISLFAQKRLASSPRNGGTPPRSVSPMVGSWTSPARRDMLPVWPSTPSSQPPPPLPMPPPDGTFRFGTEQGLVEMSRTLRPFNRRLSAPASSKTAPNVPADVAAVVVAGAGDGGGGDALAVPGSYAAFAGFGIDCAAPPWGFQESGVDAAG